MKYVYSIDNAIEQRRATRHFKPDPLPEGYLEEILRMGMQAPSEFNLQPWRIIVVQDKKQKQRLCEAAWNQEKIIEAPLVLVMCGHRTAWHDEIVEIANEAKEIGAWHEDYAKMTVNAGRDFLESFKPHIDVWLNRNVSLASMTIMLVAQCLGINSAPLDFDPDKVAKVCKLPEDVVPVTLIALGYAAPPVAMYPGRRAMEKRIFKEQYNGPYKK